MPKEKNEKEQQVNQAQAGLKGKKTGNLPATAEKARRVSVSKTAGFELPSVGRISRP